MDTAKKVLADEDATQEEVDAASTVLKNAVDKLVKVDEQKKPEQKPSDSNKDKNQEKPVKTGDTMTVLPVAVLMAACVAVVAEIKRKRREGCSFEDRTRGLRPLVFSCQKHGKLCRCFVNRCCTTH